MHGNMVFSTHYILGTPQQSGGFLVCSVKVRELICDINLLNICDVNLLNIYTVTQREFAYLQGK